MRSSIIIDPAICDTLLFKARITAIAIFFLTCGVNSGICQSPTQNKITYGGDKSYQPYEFINDKNQPDGFHIDLMKAIGQTMGFEVEFKLVEWSKVEKMILEQGSVDVTDHFYAPYKEEKYSFAEAHTIIAHELIGKRGNQNIKEIKDIANASILVQKGTLLESILNDHKLNLKVFPVATEEDALLKLHEDQYDYALVSMFQGHKFIEANEDYHLTPIGPVLFPFQLSFVAKKGNDDLVIEINEAIKILKKTGQYSKIYIKWFGQAEPTFVEKYLYLLMLIIIGMAILVFLWIKSLKNLVRRKTKDLSEQLREKEIAEKKLIHREKQLVEAQNIANLGSWTYDNRTKKSEWSIVQKKIFGLEKTSPTPEYEEYISSVHPDDQKLVKDTFKKAFKEPLIYSYEFRITNMKNEFKHLLMKIKPTFEGDSRAFIGLHGTVQDITHIKTVQAKLEEKNRELIKKNVELDKFTYSISHDLKAPIASIIGLINLMKMDIKDELTLGYVNRVEQSIFKLDYYIKDVLAYSTNENKSLEVEKIDFETIINAAFDLHQYMKGANNIRLILNNKFEGDFVSDSNRLLLIFSNIISNAIKYQNPNEADPFLKIDISGTFKKATIVIEDNGEGINEEHLDKVFNMFYRGSINSDGSGLGLYIVKEAVKRLSGTIHAESTHGHGTIFLIRLPALEESKN